MRDAGQRSSALSTAAVASGDVPQPVEDARRQIDVGVGGVRDVLSRAEERRERGVDRGDDLSRRLASAAGLLRQIGATPWSALSAST